MELSLDEIKDNLHQQTEQLSHTSNPPLQFNNYKGGFRLNSHPKATILRTSNKNLRTPPQWLRRFYHDIKTFPFKEGVLTQFSCGLYSNLLPVLLKSIDGFTQIYYRIYSNLLPDLLNSVYKFTQFSLFLQRKVRKIQGISPNKSFVTGNNNSMINERCPTKQNPCIVTPSKTEAQMQGKQLCNKKYLKTRTVLKQESS